MGNWTTKTREEIEGFQVDVIMYGKGCLLGDKDKAIIARRLKRGARQGQLGTVQAGRSSRIWTIWKVPFLEIKVGDIVEFSTSGKYNPGFHSTFHYKGKVERITEQSKYSIEVEGRGSAIVPIKHIERVL